MKNFFASNIKVLRHNKGWNQAKTADSVGFNRITWNNYETGKSTPNVNDLFTISKFFGVTITHLLEIDLSATGDLNNFGDASKNHNLGDLNSDPNSDLKGQKAIKIELQKLQDLVKMKDKIIAERDTTIQTLKGQIDGLKSAIVLIQGEKAVKKSGK